MVAPLFDQPTITRSLAGSLLLALGQVRARRLLVHTRQNVLDAVDRGHHATAEMCAGECRLLEEMMVSLGWSLPK